RFDCDWSSDVCSSDLVDNPTVKELAKLLTAVSDKRRKSLPVLLETFHDAAEKRQEVALLFELGYLTLDQKSMSEKMYWSICITIDRKSTRLNSSHSQI